MEVRQLMLRDTKEPYPLNIDVAYNDTWFWRVLSVPHALLSDLLRSGPFE
jgi:hypothetical protein